MQLWKKRGHTLVGNDTKQTSWLDLHVNFQSEFGRNINISPNGGIWKFSFCNAKQRLRNSKGGKVFLNYLGFLRKKIFPLIWTF